MFSESTNSGSRVTVKRLLHLIRQLDAWLVPPAIVFVIYGELTHDKFAQRLTFGIWDKALHFTAYFGLCLMTTVAVRAKLRSTLLWALALVAMGGCLEVIQGLTGRDADIFDELANTLGVICGFGVGWAGVAFLKARKLVEATPPE